MIKSFRINKQKGRFSLTPPTQCLNEKNLFKNLSNMKLFHENNKLKRPHLKGAATWDIKNIPRIIKYRILVDPFNPDGCKTTKLTFS